MIYYLEIVRAISLNIGEDYWNVFRGTFGLIVFLVLLGPAVILFGIAVWGWRYKFFEGKKGFLTMVCVYVAMVAILGPLIYFGLLNFEGF